MTPWRLPSVSVPLGLRLFFRGIFLLLALATLAMAVGVLLEEKQLGHRNYQAVLRKTQEQIVSRLRHPTGQLALLNPRAGGGPVTPLKPLVLPFSAIDFDDKAKVQQAVEMAGCLVQYQDGANLCVAIGNNPFAGGFIYLAGSFASGPLAAHLPGDLDFSTAHRVRVTVEMRGQTFRWIAPFETLGEGSAVGPSGAPGLRGRLTGYVDGVPITHGTKTVRDFRGWLWQDGRCIDPAPPGAEPCAKRSFLSIRLPVEVFRDALFQVDRARIVWPPEDLDRILVRLQVLPPGEDATPLFDSNRAGAEPPFALADLNELLLPGERLQIRRQGAPADLVTLVGKDTEAPRARWIDQLVRRLPVEGYDAPLQLRETVATPLSRYDVVLTGDVRSVNKTLAAVATRLSGFVGAMLAAVILAWALIELRIIRRITLLTKRAASVSSGMKAGDGGLPPIDLTDLRGRDELGVLAQGLKDLLQRVHDDVRREHIRAQQEKDQWHAVGHEIMSPLQSLMALHGTSDDPSHRYIRRMQQAVQVLYGQASPSEAFESTTLQVGTLDLDAFLGHVATNAEGAGIAGVAYRSMGAAVLVRADEYSLEDVVTHVLRNADRHRTPGSVITLELQFDAREARVEIRNDGSAIDEAMLEKIFEYGVSDQPGSAAEGHRGQGLFVARTYMAKMGGTIAARNDSGGVVFTLRMPRA
jgi:signal transduction histidine kinase